MAIERIWQNVKAAAKGTARRRTALTAAESHRIVESICSHEGVPMLPRDALEYLARELVRLSEEARRRR